jgi:N-acetylmuramoyl-L-alanine amidase
MDHERNIKRLEPVFRLSHNRGMLKAVLIFWGAMLLLTGCGVLSPPRNPNQPLPPNWDITQDHPPAPQPAVPPATSPPTATPPVLATNEPAATNAEPAHAAAASTNTPSDNLAATASAESDDYEETWVFLNHWAKARGIAPAERLSLPPLEMAITNGYRWQDFSLKARISLIPLPTFLLHTTNGVLMLQPASRTAYWDDVELRLGFAPEQVQGELLVHTQDLVHTIEPLLRGRPALPATNRTIVIDPGYDDDQGDLPDGLRGTNFALDWAQRLAPLLATNGWTVFLTRTNALIVPPARRAAFADMRHPDLFLHLCFGLKGSGQPQNGLATYCLAPADMPANESQGDVAETGPPFPNNAFDAENLEYAFCLHHALNDVPDVVDRGLFRSRSIAILRGRNCPAVCVSGGSLSDPHDAALIASPLFRQQLAEAVASALQ